MRKSPETQTTSSAGFSKRDGSLKAGSVSTRWHITIFKMFSMDKACHIACGKAGVHPVAAHALVADAKPEHRILPPVAPSAAHASALRVGATGAALPEGRWWVWRKPEAPRRPKTQPHRFARYSPPRASEPWASAIAPAFPVLLASTPEGSSAGVSDEEESELESSSASASRLKRMVPPCELFARAFAAIKGSKRSVSPAGSRASCAATS